MRVAVYGLASTALAVSVCVAAALQRPNFYSACIHISQSNVCLLALCNFGLFLAVMFGKLVKAIMFGDLRRVELEHIYERSWYAVTETCLAMTSFHGDVGIMFFALFTGLLFIRIFHWIYRDRVEAMDQAASIPRTFHVRMVGTFLFLAGFDLCMLQIVLDRTLRHGPGVMIMFGFEFAILIIHVFTSVAKYALTCISTLVDEPFESKPIIAMIIDIVSGFLKMVVYTGFFLVTLTSQRVPLHFFRDLYDSVSSLLNRVKEFRMYRKATSHMDRRYPNATAQELANCDATCIVCRDEMTVHQDPNAPTATTIQDTPKRLPCGHILHFSCLRSWLERQQSCPICRRGVLAEDNPSNPNDVRQPIDNNPNRRLNAGIFNQGPGGGFRGLQGTQNGRQSPVNIVARAPEGLQLPPGWAYLPLNSLHRQQPFAGAVPNAAPGGVADTRLAADNQSDPHEPNAEQTGQTRGGMAQHSGGTNPDPAQMIPNPTQIPRFRGAPANPADMRHFFPGRMQTVRPSSLPPVIPMAGVLNGRSNVPSPNSSEMDLDILTARLDNATIALANVDQNLRGMRAQISQMRNRVPRPEHPHPNQTIETQQQQQQPHQPQQQRVEEENPRAFSGDNHPTEVAGAREPNGHEGTFEAEAPTGDDALAADPCQPSSSSRPVSTEVHTGCRCHSISPERGGRHSHERSREQDWRHVTIEDIADEEEARRS